MNASLLMAAGACYFFLKKSNKIQDSKDASLPHKAFAAISQHHGLGILPLLSLAHSLRFRANSHYALPTTQGQHVLPDFAGSCSAVEEKKREKRNKRKSLSLRGAAWVVRRGDAAISSLVNYLRDCRAIARNDKQA